MEKRNLIITFYGGTESPTGSNFMVDDHNHKILIDCGLRQGCKMCDEVNRKKFSYNPSGIDALFVTHAHIDHIGRIPKLVKEGFKGKIYSTAPTKDISELMLIDSIDVLSHEAREEGNEPIYNKSDVEKTMQLWDGLQYNEEKKIGDYKIILKNAGHILGSSMVEITHSGKKILFSGDLGNSPTPLLPDTEKVSDIDYLIIESVYGDRNHEERNERKYKLEDVIEDTINKGGVLMIPAFSLERTQDLLYEIRNLSKQNRIPEVPVYVDSPLAIDVTKIYKKYDSFFNKSVKSAIKEGGDIFRFQNIHFTYTRDESMQINKSKSPKIIIAGSGMSNGGRIQFHEKMYLNDPKNTLLIIGYQVPGSLGRQLVDGIKSVVIMGEEIKVKARIENIRGYSAHKDSENLLKFVEEMHDTLKHVYVVLGEPKSSSYLSQRIRDYLGVNATIPKFEEKVIIDL